METTLLLAVLVLIQAASLAAQLRHPTVPRLPTIDNQPPVNVTPINTGHVELLIGRPGAWRHHSTRPGHHADISEAILTPGMAVRYPDGTVIEGEQGEQGA